MKNILKINKELINNHIGHCYLMHKLKIEKNLLYDVSTYEDVFKIMHENYDVPFKHHIWFYPEQAILAMSDLILLCTKIKELQEKKHTFEITTTSPIFLSYMKVQIS